MQSNNSILYSSVHYIMLLVDERNDATSVQLFLQVSIAAESTCYYLIYRK